LNGILSASATLPVGLGGLITGVSFWFLSELRSDSRQFREANSREHGVLAARIDALNTRVDGLSAQPQRFTSNVTEHVASARRVA